MRALLDVNALIALQDRSHLHHAVLVDWLSDHESQGWASCPLTQNGCLRVMSQPAYPASQPLAVVRRALRASTESALHVFWPDSLSLLDAGVLRDSAVVGPRQLTDLYLLALAVAHRGRLVTLDAKIPLSAVPGAKPDHLVMLGQG